jgi:hypothetical protein
MQRRRERQGSNWLSGFGRLDWRGEDRAYAALLDALTRNLVSVESAEIERVSPSRRSMEEVRHELEAFRAAILDLRARQAGNGQAEVAYDSKDPAADERAEVLIQYLVRPGYAEVRTEEPQAGQYVYYIRVDWDSLQALATRNGQPLPA